MKDLPDRAGCMTRALACVPSSRQACTAWAHCGIQTVKPCSKPATESSSPIIPPHAHLPIDTPSPSSHWANKTEEMSQGKAFGFPPRLAKVPFSSLSGSSSDSNSCRENQGRNEEPGRSTHLWQNPFKLLAEIR